MTARRIVCGLLLLAALGLPSAGRAAVEWRTFRSWNVEGKPVDITMSPDGQTTFVLTDRGEVLIYTLDGKLRDKLVLGEPADRIATTPRGDALILSSAVNDTVRIVVLEMIYNVNTEGSPFKGPAGAPVTVVVFTDFQ